MSRAELSPYATSTGTELEELEAYCRSCVAAIIFA
jgi:hypothetical protein